MYCMWYQRRSKVKDVDNVVVVVLKDFLKEWQKHISALNKRYWPIATSSTVVNKKLSSNAPLPRVLGQTQGGPRVSVFCQTRGTPPPPVFGFQGVGARVAGRGCISAFCSRALNTLATPLISGRGCTLYLKIIDRTEVHVMHD